MLHSARQHTCCRPSQLSSQRQLSGTARSTLGWTGTPKPLHIIICAATSMQALQTDDISADAQRALLDEIWSRDLNQGTVGSCPVPTFIRHVSSSFQAVASCLLIHKALSSIPVAAASTSHCISRARVECVDSPVLWYWQDCRHSESIRLELRTTKTSSLSTDRGARHWLWPGAD